MVTKFITGNRYLKLSTDGTVTVNTAPTTPAPLPLNLAVTKVICLEDGYCGVIQPQYIDFYAGKKIEAFDNEEAYQKRIVELTAAGLLPVKDDPSL